MILLPDNIPVAYTLRSEGMDVRFYGLRPDATPSSHSRKVVYFLNLMPNKPATELDIFRQLALSGCDLTIVPVRIPGQTYKTTPQSYVEHFYADILPLMPLPAPQGLIVTGAPLEQIPLTEVRYWKLLRTIMDWAQEEISSTLYICWAAQAALAHFFGIGANPLPQKRFGIYPQTVLDTSSPLMAGLGREFPMPVSRHAQVKVEPGQSPWLSVLATNPESGLGIAATHPLRSVFVTGHLEYRRSTLDSEYRRDLSKSLPINPPINYYEDDDARLPIKFSWEKAATTFYSNWIKLL